MKRIIFITWTMTIGLILSGCIANNTFRTEQSGSCKADSGKPCIIEIEKDGDKGYELGFVEFTERGNRFNETQKNLVLAKAKEYIDNNGTVIVFVHGWHHNADMNDSNVQSMREGLLKISKHIRNDNKVFGIYVGWRGESFRFLETEMGTFWDRKAVAQEVGNGGVSEFFLDLERIRSKTKAEAPKLIIVGHSFGGAIVLSALEETLTSKLKDKKANPDSNLTTVGDAVILLNPAIEATQIAPLIDASQEIANTMKNDNKLLHVISSTGDTPTHVAFPIGQWLNLGLTWNQANINRSYMQPDQTLSELEMDTKTVGNFKPFHTGNILKSQKLITKAFKPIEDGDAFGDWTYKSCCGGKLNGCELSSDTKTHMQCEDNFPLSMIYADETFMENHNDVFNNAVIAFISASVSIQKKSFSEIFTSFYEKLEGK